MINIQLIGIRHPLSPTNFKGGNESSSASTTTSETTEASTTQGSGAGDISVSNGGTVIDTLSPQDVSVISQALSFAGGIVEPVLTDLNDTIAAAQQIANNSLNT